MKPIPNIDRHFSEEVDGIIESGWSIDLRLLLSVSIDELDLNSETNARLRQHGITNLGMVMSRTSEALEWIGLSQTTVAEIENQLAEQGFRLGMNFDPALLSNVEYHTPDS